MKKYRHMAGYLTIICLVSFLMTGCHSQDSAQSQTETTALEQTVQESSSEIHTAESVSETESPESEAEIDVEAIAREVAQICGEQNQVFITKIDTTSIPTYKGDNLKEISYESGSCIIDGNGNLVKYSNFELELPDAPFDEEMLHEKSLEFYQKLPLPQNYDLISLTCQDGYAEAFFSREVFPNVYSDFEAVKMFLSLDGSHIISCRSFYIPAEPAPEQAVQLTEEEALEKAQEVLGPDVMEIYQHYESGKIRFICVNGTPAEYTTPVWALRFVDSTEHFVEVWIDLYSGEYLGGDRSN